MSVFIAVPISTLHADEKAPESKKNLRSPSIRTAPELPAKDNKRMLKIMNLMKRDKEAALEFLLSSLKGNDSAAFYLMAGSLLAERGDTIEALAHFYVAIDKFPNFLVALRSAGIIEVEQENFEEGRVLLLRAYELKEYPDHAICGSLGLCYESAGEFEIAEYYYRQAAELNPNYRGWKLGLAKAFQGQSKHEEANIIMESTNTDASE